jgi:AcrR family transcriptional regulator
VGSFYAYFTDKKDVLKESVRITHDRIHQEFESFENTSAFRSGNLKSILEEILRISLRTHRHLPNFHRELKFLRYNEPELIDFLAEQEELSYKQTMNVLRRYDLDLNIDDIEAAAVVVHRTIEHFVHFLTYDSPKTPQRRIVAEVTDMLFRYLVCKMDDKEPHGEAAPVLWSRESQPSGRRRKGEKTFSLGREFLRTICTAYRR